MHCILRDGNSPDETILACKVLGDFVGVSVCMQLGVTL